MFTVVAIICRLCADVAPLFEMNLCWDDHCMSTARADMPLSSSARPPRSSPTGRSRTSSIPYATDDTGSDIHIRAAPSFPDFAALRSAEFSSGSLDEMAYPVSSGAFCVIVLIYA